MVVADSVTVILFSIAKYSGEKYSQMESEVIPFVKPCAAIEEWGGMGDFSIHRGFESDPQTGVMFILISQCDNWRLGN
jgi:hypothetical protein